MPRFRMMAAAVVASGALMLMLVDARAERIACEGNFQLAKGEWVASSYCQDRNLALVAQSYGIRVSARELRNSETTKGQVCRAIGFDNRVEEVCAPYLGRGIEHRPASAP